MKEDSASLQGIYNIVSPSAPWQYSWEQNAPGIIFLSLLTTFIIAFFLRFIWQDYFSKKGKAKHRLSSLQHQHRKQKITNQHAAFQLSEILCDALNINQLSNRTALPATLQSHKQRWKTFIEALTVVRYSPAGNTHEVTSLFNDAFFWLQRWPRAPSQRKKDA